MQGYMGSKLFIVLKGASLASVIGVTELMRNAQMVAYATFLNLQGYLLAAAFYVVLVFLRQVLASAVERRLSLSKG